MRRGGRGDGKARAWPLVLGVGLCALFFAWYHSMFVFAGHTPFRLGLLGSDNTALENTPGLTDSRGAFHVGGRERHFYWVGDEVWSVPFLVDDPRTLRLKVNAYTQKTDYTNPAISVSVNGASVAEHTPAWNGDMEEIGLRVPAEALVRGENTLGIEISGGLGHRVGIESIDARDYVGVSKNFPRSFVVFDHNHRVAGYGPFRHPFDYVLYPAVTALLWVVSSNLASWARRQPLEEALRGSAKAYAPTVAVFFVAAAFSLFSPFAVILDRSAFLVFVLAPPFVFAGYSMVRGYAGSGPAVAARRGKDQARGNPALPARGAAGAVTGPARKAAGWAATAGVAVFTMCLIAAGVLLILKDNPTAERMADVAYFSLVFAVVMRVFDLGKR